VREQEMVKGFDFNKREWGILDFRHNEIKFPAGLGHGIPGIKCAVYFNQDLRGWFKMIADKIVLELMLEEE
jgi:hypothetical protein